MRNSLRWLLTVVALVINSCIYAADLRFDPDGDGVDEFVVKEEGGVSVGEYSLPAADGSSGQVLATDGAGDVSWQTVSSSSQITTDYVMPATDGAPGQVLFTDGAGNVSWGYISSANISGWSVEDIQIQHLKLNENDSGTLLVDAMGNINAQLMGGKTTSEKSVYAVIDRGFNLWDSGEAIKTNVFLDVENDFAVSFWFKAPYVVYQGKILWGTAEISSDIWKNRFYLGYNDNGNLSIGLGNMSFNNHQPSYYHTDDLAHWYYLEWTAETGVVRVLVDNEFIFQYTNDTENVECDVALGAVNKSGEQLSHYARGIYDDYRFFTQKLTLEQRSMIYNDGCGIETDAGSVEFGYTGSCSPDATLMFKNGVVVGCSE